MQKPNVAIFPYLGMGHFIPFVELAKRLAAYHGFSITFITTTSYVSDRQIACAQNLAASGLDIRLEELPQVKIQEDEKMMKPVTLRFKIMDKLKDLLESLLKNLVDSSSPPICAFITDMFTTATLEITGNLNIPTYIFVTSSAAFLSLMLHLPTLTAEVGCVSFKDILGPLKIPRFLPIPVSDLPYAMKNRAEETYDFFLQHCFRIRKAKGFLINTFHDLESKSINALLSGNILGTHEMPSIYPIGPIISSPPADAERVSTDKADCLKWLDRQPASSVIFVSFGSVATLSAPQMVELALGLEASGQRFLWVISSPPSPTDSPQPDIHHLLPQGFESRTKERGLVVESWAPQIPILSHPSTGGFLSHCGWNSTLESIFFGVPIIALPIQAEQRMNRLFLVNEIKVAIEVKMGMDGIASKEEVERAARELMEEEEGMGIRMRMGELRENAKKAIAGGGTSYNSLAAAATVWKKNALLLQAFDGKR